MIYSTTNDVSAHLKVRLYTLETGPAKWFDTTIHQNYAESASIDDAIFRVFLFCFGFDDDSFSIELTNGIKIFEGYFKVIFLIKFWLLYIFMNE